MKFASRSAIASLSSPNAGSSTVKGNSEVVSVGFVGVVWEARRLVRDAGRSGVVGREGSVLERAEVLRLCAELDSGRGVTTVVAILLEVALLRGLGVFNAKAEVEVEAGSWRTRFIVLAIGRQTSLNG